MVDLRCMTTVTALHSFLSPTSEQEEKDRLQKNLQPEKPFDEVFPPFAASCSIACL